MPKSYITFDNNIPKSYITFDNNIPKIFISFSLLQYELSCVLFWTQ